MVDIRAKISLTTFKNGLCRTRIPILMTVSNVHFKINMNSEKPGPAVPLQ